MASISKSRTGWRVRIRLKGHPVISKIFIRKAVAKSWATQTEQALGSKM